MFGCLLFAILDYTKRPRFLYKYKIQPGTNAPPDRNKMIRLVKTVTLNLAIGFVGLASMWPYFKMFGDPDVRKVPAVHEFFFYLLMCILCHDAAFYHGHR